MITIDYQNFMKYDFYYNSNTVHLFIELIRRASECNRTDGKYMTSRLRLSAGVSQSVQNVRSGLKELENEGLITIESSKAGTVIGIVDIGQYTNREATKRSEKKVDLVTSPVKTVTFSAGELNEKLLPEIDDSEEGEPFEPTPGKFGTGKCLSRADRHDLAVNSAKDIPVTHLQYNGFVPALMGYTKSLKRPGKWLDERSMPTLILHLKAMEPAAATSWLITQTPVVKKERDPLESPFCD